MPPFVVRRQMQAAAVLAVAMLGSSAFAQQGAAESPMAIYEGDGLTLKILKYSDDGESFSGQIVSGNAVYPFTAKEVELPNGNSAVKGSFVVNGTSFPFEAKEGEDGSVTFATGAKTYRLREKDIAPPAPPPPPANNNNPNTTDPNANNPLNIGPGPINQPPQPPPVQQDSGNPLNIPAGPGPVTTPDANNPLNTGGPASPPRTDAGAAAELPPTTAVRRAEFRDVNMGNVVAYTMMVPQDWQTQGIIEWSQDETPYPQQKITVTTPEGGRMNIFPMMKFMYTVVNPVPGMPVIPPNGTPVPRDIGQWYVDVAEKQQSANSNREVTNIRLVSNRRDLDSEKVFHDLGRSLGQTNPADTRVHVLDVTYDRNGVPYREEVVLSFSILPPIVNQNLRSDFWMVQINRTIAAPVDKFDKIRPRMFAAFQTHMPTARWFTQSQQLLAELSQQRIRNFAAAAKARAETYSQISQAQMDSFNKRMASMDRQQNQTVNSIYEIDDFRDTDGSLVKLSFHYKHTYSNGQGGYIQTNNSLEKPDSNYTEIFPHQFK